jgi:hypothetical protein
VLPLTDIEIRAIERDIATPAQRLVVVLAAVHAAGGGTIRHLTLDPVDLPNRRITLSGVAQPMGSPTPRAIRGWLEYRRTTWPHTPNHHLLITAAAPTDSAPSGTPTSTSVSCRASGSTASAATAYCTKR